MREAQNCQGERHSMKRKWNDCCIPPILCQRRLTAHLEDFNSCASLGTCFSFHFFNTMNLSELEYFEGNFPVLTGALIICL